MAKTKLLESAEKALDASERGTSVADNNAVKASGPAYATQIAPAVANLTEVNLQLARMLLPPPVGLPPVATTTPPFIISIQSVNAAITLATSVSTAITSTITSSVAASGAPLEPAFTTGAESVVTSFKALNKIIENLLVKPQK